VKAVLRVREEEYPWRKGFVKPGVKSEGVTDARMMNRLRKDVTGARETNIERPE